MPSSAKTATPDKCYCPQTNPRIHLVQRMISAAYGITAMSNERNCLDPVCGTTTSYYCHRLRITLDNSWYCSWQTTTLSNFNRLRRVQTIINNHLNAFSLLYSWVTWLKHNWRMLLAVCNSIDRRWHSWDEMDSWSYSQPMAFVGRGSAWRYFQAMAFIGRDGFVTLFSADGICRTRQFVMLLPRDGICQT